ncbi:MAG: response regulator [Candidatus Omnitrophota bacterium]
MDKKKILIVEDEPEMLKLLVLELETEGYQVYQAEDGEAGLRAAREFRPDVIISDVLMPRMDGNQFLKKLRESDFGKNIPFIVLTARGKMRDYFEVVQVDGFIEKPFKPEDVVTMIADVLCKRMAQGGQVKEEADKKIQPVKQKSTEAKDEIIIIQEMTKERTGKDSLSPEQATGGISLVPGKEPPRQKYLQRKKVLILENDMDAYYELQRIFGERGNALQVVSTPQECIEEANRVGPDLIILRDVFNKIDAEELANKLKTIPRFQKTPIIIYRNIGGKAETVSPAGGKTKTFVLNSEGKELFKKVNEILES